MNALGCDEASVESLAELGEGGLQWGRTKPNQTRVRTVEFENQEDRHGYGERAKEERRYDRGVARREEPEADEDDGQPEDHEDQEDRRYLSAALRGHQGAQVAKIHHHGESLRLNPTLLVGVGTEFLNAFINQVAAC